jgi:4-diphosphocytidyl-2-C-methyl-D-erythritol kinase
MLSFPNCKINLGLKITGKRADGYHNIATVFFPVPFNDAIEIIDNKDFSEEIKFTQSGIAIAGEQKDNLCIKAWQLLKNDFPKLPSIKLHLHKAIPMGAGLGGGSADGAATLLLLNQKYLLNLSETQLLSYALQLGSDCPFFIINKPCLATGRGELLQPISLTLKGYQLVIVNPGIHVNTGWAFSQLNLEANTLNETDSAIQSLSNIISRDIVNWKDELKNDFEHPVFEKFPAIQVVKNSLYQNGAVYASMSGSGSSVFGLFNGNEMLNFDFPTNYLIFTKLI